MPEPGSSAPHPTLPAYYTGLDQRREFVTRIFDQTAADYDWIVRAMSLGTGNWYRGVALREAGLAPRAAVLDVACGTGPVSRAARHIVGPEGSVTAFDASMNMLREARRGGDGLVVQGRAEQLPFADQRFDFLSMGYALRHVEDLLETFREYRRVLRPGGRLLLLEFTRPESRLTHGLAKLYLYRMVPWVSRLVTRNPETQTMMKYFWDTIEHCVPPGRILTALREAGFDHVERHRRLGPMSEYRAQRP